MRRITASLLSEPTSGIILDDRIRGVPPGVTGFDSRHISRMGWRPSDGSMPLPVLTMDEAAYIANRDLMMRFVREAGVDIAPHAKTPMSPDLAKDLVNEGAWATTVADLRQASVMARAGLRRLILANETGGKASACRLQGFVAAYPHTDIHVFADSICGVGALAQAWRAAPALPPLAVLIDIGSGRTGTRTTDQAEAVADAVQASGDRLRLAGIGAYEGNTIQQDAGVTARALDELMTRITVIFPRVRRRLGSAPELVLTAGGSLFFDYVVERLAPIVRADGHARLVLRSGAVFFYDHGICQRFLHSSEGHERSQGEVATPRTVPTFAPALRLWAEVLSSPEPGLVICGLGMRDASFDQGFPMVLQIYRDGSALPVVGPMPVVTKLNDQHCFLRVNNGSGIAVGDIVEFGVTHACTTIDRYEVIYGLDSEGFVRHAFPIFFG